MSSVARRPLVVEDPSQTHECNTCGKTYARTNQYFHYAYKSDRLLSNACKVCQSAKDKESKLKLHMARGVKVRQSLTLTDARPVIFDDGTIASVGWHGDVEYFPITPLLSLTMYTTEPGLLGAISNDPLMKTVPKKFLVLASDGKQYAMWHLPWSHFNSFILKFGSEQTKPQQERAQRVLEAAFGKTAQSNQEAAAKIDQGDTVVWEENRQQHGKTHKLLADIHNDLRGATIYKDRILVIRGSVYFKRLWPEIPIEAVSALIDIPNAVEMWRRGYRPYTFGFTGKKEAKARTDQHGGKTRMRQAPPLAEIHVDDPEEAERIIKRTKPRDVIPADGCAEIVWAKPSIEDRIRRSWVKHPTMAVVDLDVCMRGWEIGEPVHVDQHSF